MYRESLDSLLSGTHDKGQIGRDNKALGYKELRQVLMCTESDVYRGLRDTSRDTSRGVRLG